MMEKEIWKDIDGYEGFYKISNFGRVKSIKYNKGKILKTHKMTSGYDQLNLYKNKEQKKHSIHRLVAFHFVSNPHGKPHVNHKDGKKNNNHYSNLEWVTYRENFDHAYGNLFDNKGENHGYSKLTNKQVLEIKSRLKNGEKYKEIAKDYGVTSSNINCIALGKTWTHINEKK